VKTEFCKNIPSHLDAVLAESYDKVASIIETIKEVGQYSVEEASDFLVSAGGSALNVDGAGVPNKDEKFFIEISQIYANEIAKGYFKHKPKKQLPLESFTFFDDNIYQDKAYKNAKGFYDSFSGQIFLLRQKNKLLSCLEIFKQVWMSMGYSWVSWDGSSFLRMNGLAFYGAKENLFVLANNALSSQATWMFYRFAQRLPCFGDDANLNVGEIVYGVFTTKEFDVINNVISPICSSYPGRSYGDISNDFYKAQLNGNFFQIRNYCRGILGPNGLKKMGQKTSA
jgi:hypothetical protein